MTSKKALKKLKNISIYEENIKLGNCCDYKGELVEVYKDEINCIEKDLIVLEIIKKKEPNIFLIKETKDYYSYMDCEYGRYWNSADKNIIKEEEYKIIKDWIRRKNRRK